MALTDVTATLYLVGCLLLLPGTVLLLPAYTGEYYGTAIYFLVAACSVLTLAAAGDISPLIGRCCSSVKRPPAGYTEAPGFYGAAGYANHLAEAPHASDDEPPTGREFFGGLFMLLGGVFFMVASLLAMPGVDTQGFIAGSAAADSTWVFRFGSCFYLCGSLCSIIGVRQAGGVINNQRATFGILCYSIGAVLYLTGGVLSELKEKGFALTWIVGSVFFVMGAVAFAVPTLGKLCACCAPEEEEPPGHGNHY